MVVKRTDVYFSRRDQYPLWYPRVLNNESALLFVHWRKRVKSMQILLCKP